MTRIIQPSEFNAWRVDHYSVVSNYNTRTGMSMARWFATLKWCPR